MKDKNVFEKAKMNAVLIPLAGFIAAAAVILAVILTAAYFGAFTRLSDREEEQSAQFDAPDMPAYVYDTETADGTAKSVVEIKMIDFSISDENTVKYKFRLQNESKEEAEIKDVRYMIYNGGKCVKSGTLAGGMILPGIESKKISGEAETEGADMVVFYVSWQDSFGISDTYKVCSK